MFFEVFTEHPSNLTADDPGKQIEPARPAMPQHSQTGNGSLLSISRYSQLRPPLSIKELLRRASNYSPLPRILIPM